MKWAFPISTFELRVPCCLCPSPLCMAPMVSNLMAGCWPWRVLTAVAVRCCLQVLDLKWPDFSSDIQKLHRFFKLLKNHLECSLSQTIVYLTWETSIRLSIFLVLFYHSCAFFLIEALQVLFFVFEWAEFRGEAFNVTPLQTIWVVFLLRAQNTKLKV